MKRYRIKSYRVDSHFIQRRHFGFLWISDDFRFTDLSRAITVLYEHVKDTHGYPRVTKTLTEQEILNGTSKESN